MRRMCLQKSGARLQKSGARLQKKGCSFAKKGVLVCKKRDARLQKNGARLQKRGARLQKSYVRLQTIACLQDMKEIIGEIKSIWPECTIVHGRPRHSESQGSIERVNRTSEQKLGAWMKENKSKNWSVGRLFVRWQINTQKSRAIDDLPYRLTFGQMPRVGISCLPLAPALLSQLTTEADLARALGADGDQPLEEAFLNNLAHRPLDGEEFEDQDQDGVDGGQGGEQGGVQGGGNGGAKDVQLEDDPELEATEPV